MEIKVHGKDIDTNLWIPLSCHICSNFENPGAHHLYLHHEVPTFIFYEKRQITQGKQKGMDWLFSKGLVRKQEVGCLMPSRTLDNLIKGPGQQLR